MICFNWSHGGYHCNSSSMSTRTALQQHRLDHSLLSEHTKICMWLSVYKGSTEEGSWTYPGWSNQDMQNLSRVASWGELLQEVLAPDVKALLIFFTGNVKWPSVGALPWLICTWRFSGWIIGTKYEQLCKKISGSFIKSQRYKLVYIKMLKWEVSCDSQMRIFQSLSKE